MTRLTPWQREREQAAAPTPADAEGYAPDAAPECWVRRSTGGSIDFAIVLWHDARRGWLLRLGPAHGCTLIEVSRLGEISAGWVRVRTSAADAMAGADAILDAHGYTLEAA